ncbi:hypothetical protein [uncultured Lutibacter sp.]|uniref:hypothetical protein n=1 Tax=uncultured Lutibacter sp. TaxID=437739 RepID=UPI002639C36C|nr:hypothetical protein [uncultured Lutibacter sp.]
MKKLLQIVLVSSLSFLCFSCYYDEIPEHILNPSEIPTDPTDPNYVEIELSSSIQPIFTANCIGCHNENRDPDLREGNSYNALIPDYVISEDADVSKLITVVSSGHGGLSIEEIGLLKAWINQGAKNN